MRSPRMSDLHEGLLEAVDQGLVTRRTKGVLAIYNYTQKCQYDRHWTPVTRAARGLILDETTSRVVARPFPKFFNVGEMPETAPEVLPWDEPYEVTEKMDGSLGIVFCYGGEWDVATRGAFESPQAVYARENLMQRYDFNRFKPNRTILTEIVHPGNRIVVDYGDRDDLVFLASLDLETGAQDDLHDGMFGAVKAGMQFAQGYGRTGRLYDPSGGLLLKHVSNSEGYVIHWPHNGLRVKIKSEEYRMTHRMLSQVTPRRVLEAIAERRDSDVYEMLPGHVRPEFNTIRRELRGKIDELLAAQALVTRRHGYLLAETVGDPSLNRKNFALAIVDEPAGVKALAFAAASGRSAEELRKIAIRHVGKGLKAEPEAL